jgi:hypothetical protein
MGAAQSWVENGQRRESGTGRACSKLCKKECSALMLLGTSKSKQQQMSLLLLWALLLWGPVNHERRPYLFLNAVE